LTDSGVVSPSWLGPIGVVRRGRLAPCAGNP
jgi:hypothetical protein